MHHHRLHTPIRARLGLLAVVLAGGGLALLFGPGACSIESGTDGTVVATVPTPGWSAAGAEEGGGAGIRGREPSRVDDYSRYTPPEPAHAPAHTEQGAAMAGDTGRNENRARGGSEVAMFGAGCFWGVEQAFREVPGVIESVSGYSGGTVANPTYEAVCTGTTGHAEVVQVTFDPSRVSYEELVERFWDIHDPTTLNRQGPDVGTQYRSAVFYYSPEQKATAEESKRRVEAAGRFRGRPVVTEITPAGEFYRAEEYHQRYVEKHGEDACPTHFR